MEYKYVNNIDNIYSNKIIIKRNKEKSIIIKISNFKIKIR